MKPTACVVLRGRGQLQASNTEGTSNEYPQEPVALADLAEYLLRKNIAKTKLPERLVLLPEMPLTPTRKVIKGRLRIP